MKEYLLVDGYNIVFGWKHLKKMAEDNLSDARQQLLDMLSDYQGYRAIEIIVVFDAHLVKDGAGAEEQYNNITVIYTKESEIADQYIERTANELSKHARVRVATSDYLEQVMILSRGATRISAVELLAEINRAKEEQRKQYIDNKPVKRNVLIDLLDPETAEQLERMRRGL